MVDFLTERFDAGVSYGDIATYRSAISTTAPLYDGVHIGQHPLVKRLMDSLIEQRPPQARYTDTWDLDLPLRHLENYPPYDQLTIVQLRKKTVFLLAASIIGRKDDLLKIKFSSVQFDEQGRIPNLLILNPKNKRGFESICLSPWRERPQLCVVTAIQHYIQRTATCPRPNDRLFVNDYLTEEIGSDTIGHDIVSVMSASGVDTQRFKAHSIRMAVTSKAVATGLSLDEIKRRGRWRSWQVIQDYYERAQVTGNFVARLASANAP